VKNFVKILIHNYYVILILALHAEEAQGVMNLTRNNTCFFSQNYLLSIKRTGILWWW